jgi:glycosidase
MKRIQLTFLFAFFIVSIFAQTIPVTFHVDANNTQYQTVQLWNGNGYLYYTDEDNDRFFELTVDLSPGTFAYHVLRDNAWGWDPNNPNYARGYPSNGATIEISDPMITYLLPKDGDMMKENRILAILAYTAENPPIESSIEVSINGNSVENASQYFDSPKRQLIIDEPEQILIGINTVQLSYRTNKGSVNQSSTFVYKPIKLMTDTMIYRMDHVLSWGRVFSEPYPSSVFLECNNKTYEATVNSEGYFGADVDLISGRNEVRVAYTEDGLSNPIDIETLNAEIRRYWWVELQGSVSGTSATIQAVSHDIETSNLSFQWSLSENSPSLLSINGNSSQLSFTLPEEEGEFLIELNVTSTSGEKYKAQKVLTTKGNPHFIATNERAPWMETMVLYEIEGDFFSWGQFKFELMSQTFQHMKDLGVNAFRITPFISGGFISWDHFEIFPPYGSIDDLKAMTNLAHQFGLKVLFDVPLSHTASFHNFILTNFLLKENAAPYNDFSMWQGNPGESDIVNSPDNGRQCVYTNLENPYTQEYFTRLMEYWVEVAGADGFRIDCGQESFLRAPDYIKYLNKRLRNINPNLFLLQEGDFRSALPISYFDYGDAAYDWKLNVQWGGGKQGFPGMFKGTYTVDQLHELLTTNYPDSALVMRYANTGYFDYLSKLYGEEQERSCVAVITTTYGLPNIRAGEEVGLARGSLMYDLSDPDNVSPYYKRLIKTRKAILGNYPKIERLTNNISDHIYAYTSKSNGNIVLTVVNYSASQSNVAINLQNSMFENKGQSPCYNVVDDIDIDNSNKTNLDVQLKAWEAKVYVLDKTKSEVFPAGESIAIKSISGEYEINTDHGSLEFITSVLPDNSNSEILWKVEGDTQLASISNGVLSACGCGEGEVIVVAYLKGNNTVEARRKITIRNQVVGLVINSKFDINVDNWSIWAPECNNILSWDNGEAKVTYQNGSTECWAQFLDGGNMTVEADKTYKISFDARASETKTISCVVRENGNNYEWISQEVTFDLTGDMQRFSTEFHINKSSSIAQIQFTIGAGNADFWFDNVSFCEVEASEVLSISQIQGNTDVSPYLDQLVQTSGEVTFTTEYGCYIQDAMQQRSGIFIFNEQLSTLQIGDGLTVKGYVAEYNGLTELTNIEWTETFTSTLEIKPITIQAKEINEDYESVLVQLENATAIEENEYSDWIISDANQNQTVVDDKFFLHELEAEKQYDLTGIIVYRYEVFGLNPRFETDIEEQTVTNDKIAITFQVDMQNETVASDVYLRGSFNNWSSTTPLEVNGNIYSTTLEFDANETIEYKFVNGENWEELATGTCTSNSDYINRTFTISQNTTILDPVCFNSCNACQTMELLSISEIQGTSDDSPYLGQKVKIQGVVTLADENGFFIQDANETRSGIYVSDSNREVYLDRGSAIALTGIVDEYDGLTRLKDIESYEFITTFNIEPIWVEQIPLNEDHESLWVQAVLKIISQDESNICLMEFKNGIQIIVDKTYYNYIFPQESGWVSGIVSNKNNSFQIYLIDAFFEVSVVKFDENNIQIYPNPAKNLVTITGLDKVVDAKISIFDAKGSRMYSTKNNAMQTIQVDISSFAKGEYIISIENTKEYKTVKLIKE